MKRLLSLVAFFATLQASAQQVNPVPDYVFRNQMSVGRGTVTDTAAYFSIGPRYGANKGFMPPIVGDTATFSSGKRNGLLIFSVQKNKFLYWDSVRVQWSDMAGSSGTYITGSGITGYVPQFSGTTTIDTSGLFTLGSRLGIGTTSFAYTSASSSIELNGTSGGILGFKRNDSARGYLWHTGDNMELANTTAGAISFNTNSATRGSISSAGVWRLHNLAGTGDRVVVASSNGTLSASTSVTGLVDTTTISTRAWRQKGLDSLAALEVSGSGTTNYVPKFTASTTLGNSQIFDNGTNVGIGTTSPGTKLSILDGTATNIGPLSGNNTFSGLSFTTSPSAILAANYNILGNGTDLIFNRVTGGNIQFRENNSNQVTILSGGNIGIGTTTDAGYKTDIAGTLRSTLGANFATTSGNVGIGTASPSQKLHVSGGNLLVQRAYSSGNIPLEILNSAVASKGQSYDVGFFQANDAPSLRITEVNSADNSITGELTLSAGDGNVQLIGSTGPMVFNAGRANSSAGYIVGTNHLRIFANGRIGVNTTTDAGYQLDINGTLRSVNGANFATTSGNIGIGTESPSYKLDIRGTARSLNEMRVTSGSYLTNYNTSLRSDGGANGILQLGNNNINYILAGNTLAGGFLAIRVNVSDETLTSGSEALRIKADGELLVNTTTDGGDYKLQVAGNIYGSGLAKINDLIINGNSPFVTGANVYTNGQSLAIGTLGANLMSFFTNNNERGRINSAGEWIIDASGTDAGDYKLQVVGNARIGTGKLDISSNTAFSMNVQRSGTSEVAGTFNNSNAILYLGAESSAGGAIFTGSSSYAAVIGSGAAYPLQFATNNVTRATINTNGELLINTLTDNGDFKLQVNGNALISGSIKTANGASSTAQPWHLGSVVATNVQLDTANYVEVEINGTFYRLAIVTPL